MIKKLAYLFEEIVKIKVEDREFDEINLEKILVLILNYYELNSKKIDEKLSNNIIFIINLLLDLLGEKNLNFNIYKQYFLSLSGLYNLVYKDIVEELNVDHNLKKYIIENSHSEKIFNEVLNEEQIKMLNFFKKNNKTIISSPTSVGKSFLLKMLLMKKIKESHQKNFVIVAPTLALCNEYYFDLKEMLSKEKMDTNITTMTNHVANNISFTSNIFILTQEKLMNFITEPEQLKKIDCFVFDEIQQTLINIFNERSMMLINSLPFLKDKELLFLAPLSKNFNDMISIFINDLNLKELCIEKKYTNQFIINLNKKKKMQIFNIFNNENIEIKYNLESIYDMVDHNEMNIIYTSKQNIIKDFLLIKNRYEKIDNEYINLVLQYILKYIASDKYIVFKALILGIGIHHGDIDPTLRMLIEKLYKLKIIKTIICTSTLFQGVNLTANNLYILHKRSDGNYKNITNFYNLIGRVDRIGSKSIGNVWIKDDLKLFEKLSKNNENFLKNEFQKSINEIEKKIKSKLEKKYFLPEDKMELIKILKALYNKKLKYEKIVSDEVLTKIEIKVDPNLLIKNQINNYSLEDFSSFILDIEGFKNKVIKNKNIIKKAFKNLEKNHIVEIFEKLLKNEFEENYLKKVLINLKNLLNKVSLKKTIEKAIINDYVFINEKGRCEWKFRLNPDNIHTDFNDFENYNKLADFLFNKYKKITETIILPVISNIFTLVQMDQTFEEILSKDGDENLDSKLLELNLNQNLLSDFNKGDELSDRLLAFILDKN